MSDPLRTGSRALDAAAETDRDGKIEQLLLLGLDYYFAGQYEQAINVWTRALFLDRSHARARAYIERARSALAERQRESEELLQTGVAAFHRGDGDEARRLLRAAIDGGAPPEEALALLDRLNRLGSDPLEALRSGRSARTSSRVQTGQVLPSTRALLFVSVLLVVAVAGMLAVTSWERLEWRSWFARQETPTASAIVPAPSEVALPLPRRGETALVRARALAAGGHLRDALTILSSIRSTDPEKLVADRLRADIQRQLLALASFTAPAAEASDTGDDRLP